ncbi:hypothetical protein TIFTF001_038155 [Ficus carica]|uniref:Putative plant transposon protein domain-containing protein n=1 Tax=Ficus carica TaxID=3494 RepID=A0AA88JEA0_FICCA|nr:hypothetical protein TIFTF001_038147 [Ficus carica]GMN69099.1 hypothetical protein TIFTF001_038149 [Ficus carica]GMN69102.1 hypothetical protein TIFTF001_038153 [Ficus carica]GMN69105.1 hypothetical protein TIFTF001_038155 [Ficus carica]
MSYRLATRAGLNGLVYGLNWIGLVASSHSMAMYHGTCTHDSDGMVKEKFSSMMATSCLMLYRPALGQHPSVAIIPLVKEFYANFDDGSPNSVYVRGKRVDISGATINKVYRLDDVEDEYLEFSKRVHENQLSEIVKEICVPGTEWIKSTRGSISLSRCNLKPGPMIWNHFLKSKLMPSTHDHTVNKDRIILLFAIVVGRKLDVGGVISEQIGVCASRQSGSLWFPSLITSLCLAQGVEPKRDVIPEAMASSHSKDEAHDVPTTAPTIVRDKGKNAMTKPVGKKSILRSATN